MATKSRAKTASRKPAAKKTVAKTTAKARSGPAKTKAATAQTSKTKTAAKKPVAKKPVAKKAAVKKPAAKKPAAKKAAAPKAAAPKAAAKPKTAPKKPAAVKKSANSTAKKAVKKAAEKTSQAAPKVAPKPAPKPQKLPRQKDGFKIKDHIVYPTHGVGLITDIEEREVAGMPLQLFVIEFEQEKMTLRVPLAKAKATGMRQLSSKDTVKVALQTLRGRARIKRTMWSRRAQEYEAKINSGDLISIAEVVRDLHRAEGQPEQSYSERQLYEAALDRLSRELAAVERIAHDQAVTHVEKVLSKAA